MLVLARRINESIMIGEDIEVVVIDIKGDQVKLGIRAPKKISVHRKEIFDDIKQANIGAISPAFSPEKLRDLSDFFRKNDGSPAGPKDKKKNE